MLRSATAILARKTPAAQRACSHRPTGTTGVHRANLELAGTVVSNSPVHRWTSSAERTTFEPSIHFRQINRFRSSWMAAEGLLRGSGKSVAGGGLLRNSIAVSDQAAVRPGEVIGSLSVRGTWSGRLGAIRVADSGCRQRRGTSTGWDSLSVGETAMPAAAEDPLVMWCRAWINRARTAPWPILIQSSRTSGPSRRRTTSAISFMGMS